MKTYRCKKQLMLDKYDDDGYLIEDEQCIIEVGEIYETCEDYDRLYIANSPAIHLVKVHKHIMHWIEIYPETLEEYFEEINND